MTLYRSDCDWFFALYPQNGFLIMTKKINKISRQMKDKFFAEGHTLPTCINEGCDNLVKVREWKYWSFKSECSACAAARKKGIERPCITQHKKTYCENHDGHLGFTCIVPHDAWEGYDFGLDLDHLDGDHNNNVPENVRTYCKFCHGRKSLENGDCNSNKLSSRRIE
jgi:5-methylcytosine-specific restriction endonuclease McrA